MALDVEQINRFLEGIGTGDWNAVKHLFDYLAKGATENPIYRQYEENVSKWNWNDKATVSRVSWFHKKSDLSDLNHNDTKSFIYAYYKCGANPKEASALLHGSKSYEYRDFHDSLLRYLTEAINDILKAEPKSLENGQNEGELDSLRKRIKDKNIINSKFLIKLYELTELDGSGALLVVKIGEILGLDKTKSWEIASSLAKKGLVNIPTMDGVIELTQEGNRTVEGYIINDKQKEQQLDMEGEKIEDNYIFIIMAMINDPFLTDVHKTIKRACKGFGLEAEKADDDKGDMGKITDKITDCIKKARFIIADITHERPNVYYEIGYAHGIGKGVILTAREGTKIHFDIQNYPVSFYQNFSQLEDEINEKLSRLLNGK